MWTGILHGIYGLGAFISPLLATVMVTHGIPVSNRLPVYYTRAVLLTCFRDTSSICSTRQTLG